MAFNTNSRTAAEMVFGNRVWFLPDGAEYGTDGNQKTASLTDIPTLEEAKATGRCLGMIDTFKWVPEYKTVTKKGFSHEINGYSKTDHKIRIAVKAQFTTNDVTSEAYVLEYGLMTMPAQGESSMAFSNPSGTLTGWLYVERRAGLNTLPDDDALAEIHVRGLLGLSDNPEHNDDLAKISYEFQVTKTPKDSFKNIGLPEMP